MCSFRIQFAKRMDFPNGKKKLSAQGSEATLSEAKVSHVQAKREDGSIF